VLAVVFDVASGESADSLLDSAGGDVTAAEVDGVGRDAASSFELTAVLTSSAYRVGPDAESASSPAAELTATVEIANAKPAARQTNRLHRIIPYSTTITTWTIIGSAANTPSIGSADWAVDDIRRKIGCQSGDDRAAR
jgi:hypothetical protein